MPFDELVSLKLLGPLELWRGDTRIELPPSKKTRALLAYLVATKRPHQRHRLCNLLWDVADDPKAALRWSLSKLRSLLDDGDFHRIAADRGSVAFEPAGTDVDVYVVSRVMGNHLVGLSAEALHGLASHFRGPFLEGLELPDFSEFQAWSLAEREGWRTKHECLLRALIDRLAPNTEAQLAPARRLVQLSPGSEVARAILVRLLFATRRIDEAEQHYQLGLKELDRSGVPTTGELSATWRNLRSRSVVSEKSTAEPSETLRQEIRYCTAGDGARIAFASIGEGPTLVKAANWLTHLEYDWKSPLWRHLARDLGREYRLVRYDQRGSGLSEWQVDISFDALTSDLEAVVEAAGVRRFALLGISQGSRTAVAYAVNHPERVSHLILYGGAARGWRRRTPEAARRREALATLMRHDWAADNPAFRQLFTTLFMPDATREQMAWFNELQRVSCSADNAARITEASSEVDLTDVLADVRVPTLVMHATRDAMVPFEEARILAAGIPGARFVPLESPNHLLLGDEPAWERFMGELRGFLGKEM